MFAALLSVALTLARDSAAADESSAVTSTARRAEMQGERAVVAEGVQCTAARQVADERPVFTLIEKCSRLLSLPRRREVPDSVLQHFDFARHLTAQ